MSEKARQKAMARHEREAVDLCDACQGTGRVRSQSTIARAKRGGNASYLTSLRPEQLSMSERGRLGGRPRELTLEDLNSKDS